MIVYGFELIEKRRIPEINSLAKLYRHVKTGACLLSVENDDENKVFGVAFATPPDDSTGLPHILEHSVLCGSRTYPVKEPFKELRKGSLNTFLNAMTWPDRTVYPVASQNLADLTNLTRVYLDAVFKPFITPETLQAQGWHYELERLDGQLTYKGVVFNEMKGVYSSPDSLIGRYVKESLFPDTVYALDSGGNPAVIPDLTYAQFKAYYDRHYHPSNAFICFCGDDRSDERLRLADEYLAAYEPIDPAPAVALQPSIAFTRRFDHGYDAGEAAADNTGGGNPKRGHVAVNWLLNDVTDAETTLALQILSHALVGTQGSPLRKVLIESGLGEGLTDCGYDSSLRQGTFSVGLKGIAPEDAGKVEQLILDTLASLESGGFDPDMVAASLNTIEFRLREANTGSFPRGLVAMFEAVREWLYGGDVLAGLGFEASLASIKAKASSDSRYFERLLAEHLLANPHRTVVLLRPDPTARQQAEAPERARLDAARAAMSDVQEREVMETVERLKAHQDRPDSAEALATIPRLTLADLEREIRLIPLEHTTVSGAQVLTHDLFTNGIVYLDVGFNLQALPQRHLPYAELFGRLLVGMGTEKLDYVKLSQRIGKETGGIGRMTHTATTRSGQASTWLFLRGKSTLGKSQTLLNILSDVLLTARLDNKERLRQIVLEEKAGLEAGLLPGGHGVVFRRLRAHYTVADWAAEKMGGIDYLLFLRELAQRIDGDWSSVLFDLEAVRQALIARKTMLTNCTLDEENYAAFQPRLAEFIASLPPGSGAPAAWAPKLASGSEGLTIPAQVNYVGKAATLYDRGYQLHGSALVAIKFVDNTWMWDRVRVQGGAYGGFALFDNYSGVVAYLSYRDPNVLGTLQIFDQAAGYLRQTPLTQGDVEKVVIGVIGHMDRYELPDAKGLTSMLRYLNGDTDALRQRLRNEVLGTSVSDLRAFAEQLEQVTRHGTVVVLGSEQAISAANESLAEKLPVLKLL